MIRVCYYKGCGAIYGEKEPLSDKQKTYGLCPKHLEISLKELNAELEAAAGAGRMLVKDKGFSAVSRAPLYIWTIEHRY
jgi:hypothetical protein